MGLLLLFFMPLFLVIGILDALLLCAAAMIHVFLTLYFFERWPKPTGVITSAWLLATLYQRKLFLYGELFSVITKIKIIF